MTLYEINRQIEETFLSCFDPETGEIIGDVAVLDDLQIARDEKIENVACYIKNLRAEAKALKEEAQTFTKRARTCENKAERLFNYLSEELDGEEFKSPKTAISWLESQAVEVIDLQQIPTDYLKFKDPEPDKVAIKKAIKAGETVPGAAIVLHNNMQIK